MRATWDARLSLKGRPISFWGNDSFEGASENLKEGNDVGDTGVVGTNELVLPSGGVRSQGCGRRTTLRARKGDRLANLDGEGRVVFAQPEKKGRRRQMGPNKKKGREHYLCRPGLQKSIKKGLSLEVGGARKKEKRKKACRRATIKQKRTPIQTLAGHVLSLLLANTMRASCHALIAFGGGGNI